MTLHQKHYFRLFLIIIATAFYFLANIQRVAIPGAVFSLLQSDLGVCASKITMLGAIFCYVYAFCQLIVGLMVDKFGGFRVIAVGCILFTLGAVMFPLSDNLINLYISRALVGFGAATFYLSAIREVKIFSKDSNFSLAVSYILFIGYSGGIVANAPFVAVVNNYGWKNTLFSIGIFSLILAVIYFITLFVFKPTHIEKKTQFSLSPFKEILSNKKNINVFIFGATNYGLYYVLQSVIGKKFLEDFCNFSVNDASVILSIMAVISAFAGTITAYISKLIGGKRAVIFKTAGILSFLSVLSIAGLLFFDIHSKIIALIFCIPAFIGSISPLLVLTLHCFNRYEVSATAVSIQNFGFFMMVGVLGMVSGMLMNVFEPSDINGTLVYSGQSYILVYLLFLVLSVVELIYAFKIKDSD